MRNPPQDYCCEEDAHAWGDVQEVAIAVPEESATVHRSKAQVCLKCGAIRRARDADGNTIEEMR
jgi:hypothetical protein